MPGAIHASCTDTPHSTCARVILAPRSSAMTRALTLTSLIIACARHADPPSATEPRQTAHLRLALPPPVRGDPCDDRKALASVAGRGGYIGCGSLPRFEIREAIARRADALSACTRAGGLRQKFVMHWTITPEGTVSDDVATNEAPPGEDEAASCLIKEVRQLIFPHPLGGGIVQVTFPLVFE